jgi:hypothetical protein
MEVRHRVKAEVRTSTRLPVAAGLTLLFSALAFHLLLFRRAKRNLGF